MVCYAYKSYAYNAYADTLIVCLNAGNKMRVRVYLERAVVSSSLIVRRQTVEFAR